MGTIGILVHLTLTGLVPTACGRDAIEARFPHQHDVVVEPPARPGTSR